MVQEIVVTMRLRTKLYTVGLKTKIEKGAPFKRSITKSIEQTSKVTEANAKSRTKKITSCMPKTVVLPNFKAHQLGLARPK